MGAREVCIFEAREAEGGVMEGVTAATEAHSSESLPTIDDVRSIGEIIRDTRGLSADQVAEVLSYQRTHGVRFGEAAVALGWATPDEVLQALATQFNYVVGTPSSDRVGRDVFALKQPFGPQAEVIRTIRAQLTLSLQASAPEGCRLPNTVCVVSAHEGDGKSVLCANLAVALAQRGAKTLVIDANMRRPRQHALFGVDDQFGLAGLLSGRRGDGVIKAVKGVPKLYVLPVGAKPPNPLELIEGPAFASLLLQTRSRFDFVLIDTPSADDGADALVTASRAGHAVVLARRHQTSVARMQRFVSALRASEAAIVGVVMNEAA
jgi:chain length determinant protein tyrosine kinase EpsG